MTYSTRQLYCLNVMGLVAWTCKQDRPDNVQTSDAKEADSAVVPDAKNAVSKPAALNRNADLPDWAASLSLWPLEKFSYHGVQVHCMGPETAPLFVVCLNKNDYQEPDASTGGAQAAHQPMSRECMKLFDLMMRSIGLSQTDVRLGSSFGYSSTADRENVGSLLTTQSRALLLLDGVSDFNQESGTSDTTRLHDSQLPVWRIPHPQVLLNKPQLKRLAWQNLKALKQSLPAQVTG